MLSVDKVVPGEGEVWKKWGKGVSSADTFPPFFQVLRRVVKMVYKEGRSAKPPVFPHVSDSLAKRLIEFSVECGQRSWPHSTENSGPPLRNEDV